MRPCLKKKRNKEMKESGKQGRKAGSMEGSSEGMQGRNAESGEGMQEARKEGKKDRPGASILPLPRKENNYKML